MNTNPARGMRDFLPSDVRKREYVISVIKEVYQKYGFEPLETPSVENLETLMGKYGEEGNQLIFKILKRGEKLDVSQGENSLSDLALRYDLTVPLARVVANYKDKLPKFFKRYQIQPVWRADRPARGRYREFYQCDVDAIGSKSMIVEAELISAVCGILEKLGFEDFIVKINHREILRGVLDVAGVPSEKHTDALVALDKIDKIGREGVAKELKQRGVANETEIKLLTFFEYFIKDKSKEVFDEKDKLQIIKLQRQLKELEDVIENSNISLERIRKEHEMNWMRFISEIIFMVLIEEKTASYNFLATLLLQEFLGENDSGKKGLGEIKEILGYLSSNKFISHVKIDTSLARGLSYYTGAIFEISVPDLAGSLGGGGRYDGLIGMFGKEQIPACGFSLGLERILVVMEERGMFPPELNTNSADVLVTIWSEESIGESLKLANELRSSGLRVLVYPEADKLGKQFKYASSINIPYVCVLGETELAENKVALKNLNTGEQETISREQVGEKIKGEN